MLQSFVIEGPDPKMISLQLKVTCTTLGHIVNTEYRDNFISGGSTIQVSN